MSVYVEVYRGKLEEALRKLKKKVEAAKILDEFHKRQFYLKPSLKKREKRKENAKYK